MCFSRYSTHATILLMTVCSHTVVHKRHNVVHSYPIIIGKISVATLTHCGKYLCKSCYNRIYHLGEHSITIAGK